MIPTSNVSNSQSFGTWETKFNQISVMFTQNVMTMDNTAGGSLNSGNGYVNGWLSVSNLAVGSLSGGNSVTSGNLNVGTNTGFFNGLTSLMTLASNSSVSNLNISVNNVSFSPTTIVSTSLVSSNTLAVNGSISSNTSLGVGANVLVNSSSFFVGNSTVNSIINSTSFSGIANNSLNLGGHPSSYYANVTNPVFSTNITVGSNVSLTTTALVIGNTTINTSINSSIFTGTAYLANNSTNLGGISSGLYQLNSTLAANVAGLTSNYANLAGVANNANNLGGTAAASYALLANPTFSGNLQVGANLVVNASTISVGNSTANIQINSTSISGTLLNFNGVINSSGNVAINGVLFANGVNGLDGMVLTTSGDGSNVFWMAIEGNGTIGGTNATIQFANNGDFDGSANLTYNPATASMYFGNSSVGANTFTVINSISFSQGNSTSNSVINSSTMFLSKDLQVSGNVGFTGNFPEGGHRNMILNGQFRVGQFPTGVANAAILSQMEANTSNSIFVTDAWNVTFGGLGVTTGTSYYAVWTLFGGAGDGSGNTLSQFANNIQTTALLTGNGSGYLNGNTQVPLYTLNQPIEQYRLQGINLGYANCSYMTLTFWAWASEANTFGGSLVAGSNNYSFPFRYTTAAGQKWTKNVIVIPPLTTGGGTFLTSTGTNIGLTLNFEMAAQLKANNQYLAPNAAVGVWTANNFLSPQLGVRPVLGNSSLSAISIGHTGIQLEKGPYSTPYEYLSIGEEIRELQRYYQISNNNNFSGWSGAIGMPVGSSFTFPVQMRTAPTITFSTVPNHINTASEAITPSIDHLNYSATTNASATGYSVSLSYIATSQLK